jgi:threonine dehydrogenase-like Zn-dependent dehydrogenase
MAALVWHGGRSVGLERVEQPQPASGQLLADVRLAGICGSDLHQYRGNPGPRRPPLILGHEAVVTVAGRPGRFVLYPLVSCGECEACVRDEENLCHRRGLLGFDRPGVFADSLAVDAGALMPIPPQMDARVAVLAEPQAASVSAMRLEGVNEDTRLAIIGCGPIGLLAVYAAKQLGVSPVVVDPIGHRREIALSLGASEALETGSALPPASFDVALDAVGAEATWLAGIASLRPGGSLVILGLAQSDGTVPVGDLVRRGIRLRGHYAYTRSDFAAAVRLLADSPPPVDWLEFAPLGHGAESFARIVDSPDQVTKVILVTDLEAATAHSVAAEAEFAQQSR